MNDLINVIDDFLTEKEIKELRELFNGHIWKQTHKGSMYDEYYHLSSMNIDEENIVKDIKIKIDKVFKEYYSDIFDELSLDRVYGSLQTPGQVSGLHIDKSEKYKPHSALLFVHSIWEPEWAGATTIYDENYDILDCALPYPNRLLLFPSHYHHNGASVHSSAEVNRQILIYQYNNK